MHFFDLLQSTTKGMNLSGVVFAKGGGKGASATETPPLNGTKGDMHAERRAHPSAGERREG